MKVIINIFALLALCGSLSAEAAEAYDLNTVCSKQVPFVLPVDAEIYQGMLNQLAPASISLNRHAIIESLLEQLKKARIVPVTGMSIEQIAEELYIKSVIPALQPGVKDFNDQLNKKYKDDRVNVGHNISDLGISKSMEKLSNEISAILIEGFYSYKNGEFEKGGMWCWDDKHMILGTSHFSKGINRAIDEDIIFDLTPYGKDDSFKLNFSAMGSIELEQTYACSFNGPTKYDGKPTTQVRVHPFIELRLSKNISGNSYFMIEGKPEQRVNKKIPHEAEFTVNLCVTEPNQTKNSNQSSEVVRQR